MTASEREGIAFLPPRDPPTGQRYRLSLRKVGEELERYLPSARVEAANRLQDFTRGGAPENKIANARAELTYIEHSRGPVYQAQLLEQLGQRNIDAVITAPQTPLERVREIGAALTTRIQSQRPALIHRAVQAIEPIASAEVGSALEARVGKALHSEAVQRPPKSPASSTQGKGRTR